MKKTLLLLKWNEMNYLLVYFFLYSRRRKAKMLFESNRFTDKLKKTELCALSVTFPVFSNLNCQFSGFKVFLQPYERMIQLKLFCLHNNH